MAPKSNDWCLHKRWKEIQDTQEKRRIWKWTQKFWWHIYKPRSTKDCLQPPEARTEPWHGFSPHQASKGTDAADNLISDFSLQNHEKLFEASQFVMTALGNWHRFQWQFPGQSTGVPGILCWSCQTRPQSPHNTPNQGAAINCPKRSTNLWLNTASASSKKQIFVLQSWVEYFCYWIILTFRKLEEGLTDSISLSLAHTHTLFWNL